MAARPPRRMAFPRPSFLFWRYTMHNAINRLVSAGMKREDADEAIFWLTHYAGEPDIVRYVMEYESGQQKRLANG